MEREKDRKTRCDKKRSISTLIDLDTYDLIARVAYVCEKPMKVIGEILCRYGLRSRNVIESMNTKFRREYQHENSLFLGDKTRKPYRLDRYVTKQRLYIRFFEFEHEKIADLAYALDCSVASAAELLIKTTMEQTKVLHQILGRNVIETELDERRRKQLKEVIRLINAKHHEEHITVSMALGYIIDQCLEKGKRVMTAIDEWLET